MKTVYIYTLTCPISKEILYIGKTINLKERLCGHYKEKRNNKRKIDWIKKLRNENLKPIMEVLDEINLSDWTFWEKYWISQFKTWGFNLFNVSLGGEGFNPQVGFKHSEDSKIKISQSGKGRIHAEFTKKLISKSKMGIKFSDEHLENLSKSHKGQVHQSVLKPVIQIDSVTGEKINEFTSIKEAEKQTGIANEVISKCCKNKCKRAGFYYWCYKSEFESFVFKPFEKDIHVPKSRKSVNKINPITNEIISTYESISSATISLGKGLNGRSNITKSIEKDTLAYGYKWELKK